MKELSVIEMNDVSGAYSWNFTNFGTFLASSVSNAAELAVSATVGAATGAAAGGYIGGRHGGDGGGLLGVGVLGELVGLAAGGVLGGLYVGLTSAATGWDNTQQMAQQAFDAFMNGTIA